MTPDALLAWLWQATCLSSLAVVLVLLLRRPCRRLLGARIAYLLWLAVPLAVLVAALPAPLAPPPWMPAELQQLDARVRVGLPLAASAEASAAAPHAVFRQAGGWLSALWGAGALSLSALFWWQQRRFVDRLGALRPRDDGTFIATEGGGPLVLGAWRSRIVLPPDFEWRYTPAQAALVVEHERLHVRRGDVLASLLAAFLRSLFWFNPLLHLAVGRFRQDQELACDASVLSRHPRSSRTYADAMLKTQLDLAGLPVGCHWQSGRSLKERILMLKHPQPGRARRSMGVTLVCALLVAGSWAAWAARPPAQKEEGTAPPVAARAALTDDSGEPLLPAKTRSYVEADGARVPQPVPDGARDSLEGMSPAKVETKIVDDPHAPRDVKGQPAPTRVRVPVEISDGPSPQAHDAGAPAETPAGPLQAPPKYPAAAVQSKQSGRVLLRLLVGADGRVKEALVEKSVPQGIFDEVSLAAARRWTFDPQMKDGKPVEGWVRVPISFDINGGGSDAPSGGSGTRPPMAWSTLDAGRQPTPASMVCDAARVDPARPDLVSCGQRLASSP